MARDDGNGGRKVGRGKSSGTGSFAGTQHGARNDGVTSAKPEVITGQEDATFHTDPGRGTEKETEKDA